MDYPCKLWMKYSRLNHQPHIIWGIKMNCIVEIPKQRRMGLSLSRLWHVKSGQQCLRNWKTINLDILSKNVYKEMESKLSLSVMQNLLSTCWFYIINMCGTVIKNFFILLYICYIIDVFSFSFILFTHWKVDAALETKWLADWGCSSDIASSYFSVQVKSRSMLHHG